MSAIDSNDLGTEDGSSTHEDTSNIDPLQPYQELAEIQPSTAEHVSLSNDDNPLGAGLTEQTTARPGAETGNGTVMRLGPGADM